VSLGGGYEICKTQEIYDNSFNKLNRNTVRGGEECFPFDAVRLMVGGIKVSGAQAPNASYRMRNRSPGPGGIRFKKVVEEPTAKDLGEVSSGGRIRGGIVTREESVACRTCG